MQADRDPRFSAEERLRIRAMGREGAYVSALDHAIDRLSRGQEPRAERCEALVAYMESDGAATAVLGSQAADYLSAVAYAYRRPAFGTGVVLGALRTVRATMPYCTETALAA